MEEDNGRSFNCAESVMIRVNRESPLPGFNSSCMRITSVFGGGIAGYGEVCGAISGAVVSLGLMLGTNGDETVDDFKLKRTQARSVVKEFLQEFAECWGSVQCRHLIAMDEGKRTQVGTLRPEGPPSNLCNEYVDWSTRKIHEIRSSIE
ncbi:MAG: C_GCAxxG_C_C family protein [Candidatus Thorarchaeota archaeon]|nr:C_GCAxxG_C_C family protein [Candidatus Thorarchaeota archaeon]